MHAFERAKTPFPSAKFRFAGVQELKKSSFFPEKWWARQGLNL
jgi:hypothetical protein